MENNNAHAPQVHVYMNNEMAKCTVSFSVSLWTFLCGPAVCVCTRGQSAHTRVDVPPLLPT